MTSMFVIQVLTLDNNILRYKVATYNIENDMVQFTDPKTGMQKAFPTSRTTIDEVKE